MRLHATYWAECWFHSSNPNIQLWGLTGGLLFLGWGIEKFNFSIRSAADLCLLPRRGVYQQSSIALLLSRHLSKRSDHWAAPLHWKANEEPPHLTITEDFPRCRTNNFLWFQNYQAKHPTRELLLWTEWVIWAQDHQPKSLNYKTKPKGESLTTYANRFLGRANCS